ncbi:sulfite exporter TauE/SafE family protein [Candidatus Daviesbacteria bacterium]|nr:sulfite exporter TauE/SafE family protein [Candidatus Daviesbacteria bacterium]
MDLWVVFLTGLTVGGLTCLVVQGGLLASTIAAREAEDFREGSGRKHNLLPVLAFLVTKFIAYIILGFLLGLFGSALNFSDSSRITMQILAGVYMVLVALNLLNIHPVFRYVIIQPPKFLTKIVRNTSKSADLFAPALLGVFTIFIPCGTTLAMEAFAISSGNPFWGAAILGTFVLGTTPMFLGLGVLTSRLGDAFRTRFLKIAGLLVLYIGITSVNQGLVLANSPITLQTLAENSPIQIDLSGGASNQNANYLAGQVNGVQNVDINIESSGYNPRYLQVKSGIPVKMNLISKNVYSCALAFRIPALKIAKNLNPTGVETIEFTPTKKGKIVYTCSMGMYSGIMEVI